MSRLARLALAGLLVTGVLAFAACGGGGDDDEDDTTPVATSDEGGEATTEPEPTEDGGNGDGDGGTGSEELEEVAQRFGEATFRAAYDVTDTSTDSVFGEGGSLTLYKDGQDRLRFDMEGVQEGQPFEGTFILSGNDAYICFSGDAASSLGVEGDGACIQSAANDPTNPAGGLSETFANLDTSTLDLQGTSEREIAGQDATCYDVLDTETDEQSTACFSDDGILLAMESGDTSFEATEATGDVDAASFDPPYDIVEIPGLPQ